MDPLKNPYAAILTKLSGIEPPKKKARQGHQQWMHENKDALQTLVDDAWKAKVTAGLSPKDRNDATFQADIARKEYNKLSAANQKEYQRRAQVDKAKDVERFKAAVEASKAKTPQNRER